MIKPGFTISVSICQIKKKAIFSNRRNKGWVHPRSRHDGQQGEHGEPTGGRAPLPQPQRPTAADHSSRLRPRRGNKWAARGRAHRSLSGRDPAGVCDGRGLHGHRGPVRRAGEALGLHRRRREGLHDGQVLGECDGRALQCA